jgi:hypothetical protein
MSGLCCAGLRYLLRFLGLAYPGQPPCARVGTGYHLARRCYRLKLIIGDTHTWVPLLAEWCYRVFPSNLGLGKHLRGELRELDAAGCCSSCRMRLLLYAFVQVALPACPSDHLIYIWVRSLSSGHLPQYKITSKAPILRAATTQVIELPGYRGTRGKCYAAWPVNATVGIAIEAVNIRTFP